MSRIRRNAMESARSLIEPLEARVLLSGATTLLAPVHAAITTATVTAGFSPLGGNLDGQTDRIQDHPFVDLVKTSRGFYNLAGRPASNGKIDFAHADSRGWPTEDFSFSVLDDSEYGDPVIPGTYHMSFSGPASAYVTIRQNVPNPAATVPAATPLPTLKDLGYNATTHTHYYDAIVPQGALVLAFDVHNTAGQVRDFRVLQPGYSLTSHPLFSNEYINLLKNLAPGTIRLMDWTQTNANPSVTWATRTSPTAATQTPAANPGDLWSAKGVAWEYGIQLANTIHANVWVNIPAHADDNYIRHLATLLRDTLRPDLNIYVEYSNEVWNSGFEQHQYNKQVADAEVVAGAKSGHPSDLNYDNLPVDTTKADGGANAETWADRRYARRLVQISNLFKSVWVAQGRPSPINTRVRPILCSQFSNMARFDNMLKYVNTVFGPPKNFFYGIGIAPYINVTDFSSGKNLTSSQVLAALSADVDLFQNQGLFNLARSKGAPYGLKLEAYEGGVDTSGSNNLAANYAASHDPQMGTIMTRYLNLWYSSGGDQFEWYTLGARSFHNPYGTWSITDDVYNYNEPKEVAYRAVRDSLPKSL